MLFHVRQSHAPADCPYGKGGSKSLFDEHARRHHDPRLLARVPAAQTFLVVETDDAAKLQALLRPGASVCTTEITPVTDQPAA